MEKISETLIKRGYRVRVFETASECRTYLNAQIDGTTVGIGGSVTVSQLNVYPLLKEHNTVFWHGDKEQVVEFGDRAVRDLAKNTEIYISSVNGMTEDGVIMPEGGGDKAL